MGVLIKIQVDLGIVINIHNTQGYMHGLYLAQGFDIVRMILDYMLVTLIDAFNDLD